jgi:hypothetical protein
MRTMIRRLQRLEDRTSMQRNESGETPVEVLRGRIRRLCEAEGVPFEDPPPEEFTDNRGRPVSVADILRRPSRSGVEARL